MSWKYSDRFAKVNSLQYSVPVQSEVIWGKGQTLRRLFNFPGFFFTPGLTSRFEKTFLLFHHLFITLERIEKTKNAYTVFEPYYIGTFSPNVSQNGWNLDAHELKTCAQFLENTVSRKRAKQFQRHSSGKTTRRESTYLRLTSKRLSLLHNNSTQMLT